MKFREYSPDTQFGIIAVAFVLSLIAVLLGYLAVANVWPAGGTEWLVHTAAAAWNALSPLVAVAACIGIFAVCEHYGLALWRVGGGILGWLVGLIVFASGWVYAVGHWGWLLGLAFGWIPAVIVGLMGGLLAWGLAPLLPLGAIAGLGWFALSRSGTTH